MHTPYAVKLYNLCALKIRVTQVIKSTMLELSLRCTPIARKRIRSHGVDFLMFDSNAIDIQDFLQVQLIFALIGSSRLPHHLSLTGSLQAQIGRGISPSLSVEG